jgi:hypothetical protein
MSRDAAMPRVSFSLSIIENVEVFNKEKTSALAGHTPVLD